MIAVDHLNLLFVGFLPNLMSAIFNIHEMLKFISCKNPPRLAKVAPAWHGHFW